MQTAFVPMYTRAWPRMAVREAPSEGRPVRAEANCIWTKPMVRRGGRRTVAGTQTRLQAARSRASSHWRGEAPSFCLNKRESAEALA